MREGLAKYVKDELVINDIMRVVGEQMANPEGVQFSEFTKISGLVILGSQDPSKVDEIMG